MTTNSTSALPVTTHTAVLAMVAVYAILAVFFLLVRHSGGTPGGIYLGLFFASNGVFCMCLLFWNDDLMWRRMSIGQGTKTWDYVVMTLVAANMLAIFFVAVLNFDMPINKLVPAGIAWLSGLAIYVAGWALFTWSSFVNPFFEKMVRIQTDQGHRVIDKGPYSVIRHPGYVGFISTLIATPLLLPSYWICILSTTAALLFFIRTALEDRTLQSELPGYAEYATRVRFRLISGVW